MSYGDDLMGDFMAPDPLAKPLDQLFAEKLAGPTISELQAAGRLPKAPAPGQMPPLDPAPAGTLTVGYGVMPRAPAPTLPPGYGDVVQAADLKTVAKATIPTGPESYVPSPTPHKHADLLKQWADDYSLRFFWWDWAHRAWCEASPEAVVRNSDLPALRLAHTRPTEPLKRYCTIGSFSYPEPERVAPARGTRCYYPALSNGTDSWDGFEWHGSDFCVRMLESGLVHLESQDAKTHATAILMATKAAFNKLGGIQK